MVNVACHLHVRRSTHSAMDVGDSSRPWTCAPQAHRSFPCRNFACELSRYHSLRRRPTSMRHYTRARGRSSRRELEMSARLRVATESEIVARSSEIVARSSREVAARDLTPTPRAALTCRWVRGRDRPEIRRPRLSRQVRGGGEGTRELRVGARTSPQIAPGAHISGLISALYRARSRARSRRYLAGVRPSMARLLALGHECDARRR